MQAFPRRRAASHMRGGLSARGHFEKRLFHLAFTYDFDDAKACLDMYRRARARASVTKQLQKL